MTGAGYCVLLVEDDPDFVLITSMNLSGAGHAVVHTTSMHDAIESLRRSPDEFDVLLLDLGLPDVMGPQTIADAIDHTDLPIIVLTSDGSASTRRAASELGATAFLVKGEVTGEQIDDQVRSAVVRHLTPATTRCGEEAFTGVEEAIASGADLLALTGGPECIALIRTVSARRLVLVRIGPGDELQPGDRVVTSGELAAREGQPGVRRGIGTAESVLTTEDGAPIDLGAWMAASIDLDHTDGGLLLAWRPGGDPPAPEVDTAFRFVARQLATMQELESARARATRRADIAGNAASADALTGLGNRRAHDLHVQTEDARCRRYGGSAAVFVVDLDGLKTVNDELGHAAGDRYIRAAADALGDATRDSDLVFRTGGDEFSVIAVECDEFGARYLEGRIRDRLADHGVHASVGWASRPPMPTLEAAAETADQLMYAEKAVKRMGGDPSVRPPAEG